MMFKHGDVVRINHRYSDYSGQLGIVREFSRGRFYCKVQLMSDLDGRRILVGGECLEKINGA